MTKAEVMTSLKEMGNENTKKVLMKHGAKEPFYGVKVGDLKKLVKKIKKDQALAEELYATGNSDAMYLAGLIADEETISKVTLQKWVKEAYWYMISEYTVAWVAAESKYGWELALEWIESDEEMIAAAGWSTLSSIMSITQDENLDIDALKQLMERAQQEVHTAKNRVRYTMNGFLIGAGSFVPALTEKAIKIGNAVGKVKVEMGGTACKVPLVVPYIEKVKSKNRIGVKKKMARC